MHSYTDLFWHLSNLCILCTWPMAFDSCAVASTMASEAQAPAATTSSDVCGHKALQQQTVRDPKYNNNHQKQQQQQQQEKLFVPCSNEVYDLAQMALLMVLAQLLIPRWTLP
ncbi:unnamed protein product [Polarella glacialis]|uniref:Uncharacterized protein n=1 Tax=Polarella glacialis TaxID=89957 RepID=A0A813DP94_POLGL|nr:unnamed protein product [Polarella glacialis]CAE8694893.1 unnamed protein product [Polarella glacialis]